MAPEKLLKLITNKDFATLKDESTKKLSSHLEASGIKSDNFIDNLSGHLKIVALVVVIGLPIIGLTILIGGKCRTFIQNKL